MTDTVLFNNKHVICNSTFMLDLVSSIQMDIAELYTPFGFFIPIADGGLALHRAMSASYTRVFGELNPTLVPPHGAKIRGVLVGKYVEFVSFFPKNNDPNKSMLLVSSLPYSSPAWKVIQLGSHSHDSAYAYALKDCKTPEEAVERYKQFAPEKFVEPLMFDLEKLRKSEFAKKWINLRSHVIDHDLKL